MALPHITTFCCCMGLEAGSRLIGCLHLVISISLMIFCSWFAEMMRANIGTVEDVGDHVYYTWYIIATVIAVFTVVHTMLGATLLFAVYRRNTTALRAWIWVMIALYFASLALVLVSMTFGFSSTGSDIFLQFLEGVLFYGVLAYCILCVHSYYLMLKSSEDMEGPNKQDY